MVSAFVPGAVALWGLLPAGETVQVVVTPDIAKQLVSDPEKMMAFALPAGNNHWLPQSDDAEEEWEANRWYARFRAIAEGGKPGRVQSHFTRGIATEEHWLEVVAVKHEHWGNYSIDAKLQVASEVNPLFGKGDVVRLHPYQIRACEE